MTSKRSSREQDADRASIRRARAEPDASAAGDGPSLSRGRALGGGYQRLGDSTAEADAAARRRFSRRAALIFGAQGLAAGAIAWRLADLQLVEGQALEEIAERNRIALRWLFPERGEIFAADGRPLARNTRTYAMYIIREQVKDLEETLARIRRLAPLDPEEIDALGMRLASTPSFVPTPVTERLDWETYTRLNANLPALPGVVLESGWARTYPSGPAAGHVIGYVDDVSEEDIEADGDQTPILKLPNAKMGKLGVERARESLLRGVGGYRRVEINASGREIRELERREPQPGPDMTLTLDLALQSYALERLRGQSGAAVVMDVKTGDLVCLASSPTYDPNQFVRGLSQSEWAAIRDNELDPLRDKVAAGAYPPGSTWKMITALAALENGVGTGAPVRCRGSLKVAERTFHCWNRRGHGTMRLRNGLKQSCDVYFYELAKRTGIEKIAEMARRFGAGEAPPAPLANVRAGLLPTPEWKQRTRGERWTVGDTINASIGQGAVLMTPLQLAVMTARIANGRHQVAPRLIHALDGVVQPIPEPKPLGVNANHLAAVRRAMAASVAERGGTGYRARAIDRSVAFSGKTGTSQVYSITRAERARGVRRTEDLPRHLRDHGLFVAYGPVRNPRFAIAVVIEHGGGGSKSAAPVARDILTRAIAGREPSLSAFPERAREDIARRRARRGAFADPALFSPEPTELAEFWSPGQEDVPHIADPLKGEPT